MKKTFLLIQIVICLLLSSCYFYSPGMEVSLYNVNESYEYTRFDEDYSTNKSRNLTITCLMFKENEAEFLVQINNQFTDSFVFRTGLFNEVITLDGVQNSTIDPESIGEYTLNIKGDMGGTPNSFGIIQSKLEEGIISFTFIFKSK